MDSKELFSSLMKNRSNLTRIHKKLMPLKKADNEIKKKVRLKSDVRVNLQKEILDEYAQNNYRDTYEEDTSKAEKLQFPVLSSMIKIKRSKVPQFAKVGNWDSKYTLLDEAHRKSTSFEKRFERSCDSRKSVRTRSPAQRITRVIRRSGFVR